MSAQASSGQSRRPRDDGGGRSLQKAPLTLPSAPGSARQAGRPEKHHLRPRAKGSTLAASWGEFSRRNGLSDGNVQGSHPLPVPSNPFSVQTEDSLARARWLILVTESGVLKDLDHARLDVAKHDPTGSHGLRCRSVCVRMFLSTVLRPNISNNSDNERID